MISRSALKIVLGLVLLASLGLKLSRSTADVRPSTANLSAQVGQLLERHGIEVTHGPDDAARIIGAAGACQVLVEEVAPEGWQRFAVAQTAANDDLFYTFAGHIYSEQPVLRTRTYFYWRKLQRYFGLEVPERPVLAVVSTRACPNLPLKELAASTARM